MSKKRYIMTITTDYQHEGCSDYSKMISSSKDKLIKRYIKRLEDLYDDKFILAEATEALLSENKYLDDTDDHALETVEIEEIEMI